MPIWRYVVAVERALRRVNPPLQILQAMEMAGKNEDERMGRELSMYFHGRSARSRAPALGYPGWGPGCRPSEVLAAGGLPAMGLKWRLGRGPGGRGGGGCIPVKGFGGGAWRGQSSKIARGSPKLAPPLTWSLWDLNASVRVDLSPWILDPTAFVATWASRM